MFSSLSRRTMMLMLGKAGALSAVTGQIPMDSRGASKDTGSVLRKDLVNVHPRLHLTSPQWLGLREAIHHNDSLALWYERLQAASTKMMQEPTAEYKLLGPRLLYQSRDALRRISTLAGLYRLDGDLRKADRARAELKAICAFPSWHPPHFLDVAEMTNAAALGYDWLYDVLTPEERRTTRNRIVEFGLRPGLAEYHRGVNWSLPFANNWGQVCAGGLTIGALAIANDGEGDAIAPEPAQILDLTTTKIRNAMLNYAPDGGWPEGPGYWSYATNYTCLMLSALNSSLHSDFGLSAMPGFSETGDFRAASIGPTGQSFNFADAESHVLPAPEMFWLARKFGKPHYISSETSVIARTHPSIFHLIWFPTELSGVAGPWPLDVHFSRINVAYFRTSWSDPDAMYVGFKGGSNEASHGHLDLGQFVLDALGERWALDLGPDDYDLPDYFGAKRWSYYRLRSEGHNVLTLGNKNQVVTAAAPMLDFHSTQDEGSATVDLTQAYRPAVTSARRSIQMHREGKPKVIVSDVVEVSSSSISIRWNMHTRAQVKSFGRYAILQQNGKTLKATIESPAAARFDLLDANPPKPQGQQPDVTNLVVHLEGIAGSMNLRVVFEEA